jgi:hypothetical protein
MFFDRNSMNQSYRGQKLAAKHGLAPKVGEKFVLDVISFERRQDTWGQETDAPIPFRRKIYCFFTQTATKIGKRVGVYKVADLEEAMVDIGIYHDDLHQWNMGYVGKRLVCIDFDDASCSIEKRN